MRTNNQDSLIGLSFLPLNTTNKRETLTDLSFFPLRATNNKGSLIDLSLFRLCPYNCVKEKSHSHPHDTIILDQQNFVGGNENDSTQFYLKLRRTKRTNYKIRIG